MTQDQSDLEVEEDELEEALDEQEPVAAKAKRSPTKKERGGVAGGGKEKALEEVKVQ